MEPSFIELDVERTDEWLGKGAQMTETVAKLYEIAKNPDAAAPAKETKLSKKAQAKAAAKAEADAAPPLSPPQMRLRPRPRAKKLLSRRPRRHPQRSLPRPPSSEQPWRRPTTPRLSFAS
jgi:hypothetical protein